MALLDKSNSVYSPPVKCTLSLRPRTHTAKPRSLLIILCAIALACWSAARCLTRSLIALAHIGSITNPIAYEHKDYVVLRHERDSPATLPIPSIPHLMSMNIASSSDSACATCLYHTKYQQSAINIPQKRQDTHLKSKGQLIILLSNPPGLWPDLPPCACC